MTPKEHFCHSRLVVPAQTSKAREGTHHLLVVSGFSRRGQLVRHRPPPQTAWCFPSLLEIPLTRLHHLAPGKKDQNHHKQPQLCYDRFMVCFMSLKNPRPLLGSPQNSPQKKNIAGLRNCCGCWGLPPRSPPHWKPKALAPLDCSPRRRRSMKTNQMAKTAGRHGEIILKSTDFPVGLKKTTCWKFSVKESNIINVWILQQKLWNYLGEASTLRSRSPLKWLLHQRRVMSSFHEHPHEGCSRSLLRGKFLTFFPWEPHGVKATFRECDRKINISMSEGQQPLRGPFLRHFLGNPEVRSDQSKKKHGLWRCFGQGFQGSQQHPIWQACPSCKVTARTHKILTELTLNIISKYTYSLHITWLNHNIFI